MSCNILKITYISFLLFTIMNVNLKIEMLGRRMYYFSGFAKPSIGLDFLEIYWVSTYRFVPIYIA
ncbi:hypothetical protein GW17_00047365 [Ensete ventricosum]|nr:hypothetical protein GW17_00047365 [Ensete ventricosum]